MPDSLPYDSKLTKIVIFIIVAILFIGILIVCIDISGGIVSSNISTSYDQFMDLLEIGSVNTVVLSDHEIRFSLLENADYNEVSRIVDPLGKRTKQIALHNRATYITGRINDPGLVLMLRQHGVNFFQLNANPNAIITSFIIIIAITVIPSIFMLSRFKKKTPIDESPVSGREFGMSKSKARAYTPEDSTGITFKDVAGQDEAKESLAEIVDFLNNPDKYTKIGAKQPKGALLVGPPGTGKTLLAKAVAGEAGVPFYHQNGSEFVELYVGVGASRVRDLFKTAEKNAPCIIFIDEIDAIGKKRDTQLGSNDEREQTLNQLLSEMDGFDTSMGIVILAASNRPEILDNALLRPGRFDRRIIVDKPDITGRIAILEVHAARVNLGDDVDLKSIAQATSGATGADLSNMVNEAALRAVKMGREFVLQEDLMEAVEVVVAGKEKKDRILTPKEKSLIAFHEVGHALTSALLKDAPPVQKITIVPRTMGALGYTLSVPEEERYLHTSNELKAQIIILLGGRAAEIIEFDDCTTGASNDIERATSIARDMVTRFGMSEKFGPIGLERSSGQYLDGRNISACSDETGALIDEEVRIIIEECQQTAINLLSANRHALSTISEFLLENEKISGDEFMSLLKKCKVLSAA